MNLEKIINDIKALTKEKQVFLYDVSMKEENNESILEVVFDKHGFIDSDEISEVTQIVNDYLDKANPIDSSYTLCVTSRGIEKDITFDEAKYYLKENVKVKTFEQLFNGELVEVKADSIVLKDKRNKNINIKANDIENINISDVF